MVLTPYCVKEVDLIKHLTLIEGECECENSERNTLKDTRI